MLACEELTKLVDLRIGPERSTSTSLPCLVTFAAIRMSLRPWPSSSRNASPWNTPSFQVETTARACCSAASRIASIAASTVGAPNSREQLRQPPLAEMRRAQHRREVAAETRGDCGC